MTYPEEADRSIFWMAISVLVASGIAIAIVVYGLSILLKVLLRS